MSSLFSPLTFSHGPAASNRLGMASLTNLQSAPDGVLSDEEIRWLTMRAEGGFGVVLTAAAHVAAHGQGFPGQLGVWDERHLPGLARLAEALRRGGALSLAQLHHAGIRAPADLTGVPPAGPSADAETGARAMTGDEVERARDAFIAAAVRADRAGFDGVQLHAAHGYLLSTFLSVGHNRREDRWGGSPEARLRLLLEVIDGVRAACRPDLHVAVRLSPERFGLDTAEVLGQYDALVARGDVDLIDMSLWDYAKAPNDPAFAGETLTSLFARRPRGSARLSVAGKLMRPADLEQAAAAGADLMLLGRAAILQHDYPIRMREPGFTPRAPPVTAALLADEGLSPVFVEYMRRWKGFVEE